MTEKLKTLLAALSGLRKDLPEDEAKAFLRQAFTMFLDLSPTEEVDAFEWLKDHAPVSREWLGALKKQISKERARTATASGKRKIAELMETYRLHPAVDFPAQGLYMTLGFRMEGPDGPGLLLLCSDGQKVEAQVSPETLQFDGTPWTLGKGVPPWLQDRWSVGQAKAILENPAPPPDLYPQLKQTLSRYLDLTAPVYGLLSAWAVGTYLAQMFSAYPYLHFLGPKESGKTKTLEALLHLCFNPFKGRDLSAAILGDTCEGQRGTVLLDQAERLGGDDHGLGNLVGLLADG